MCPDIFCALYCWWFMLQGRSYPRIPYNPHESVVQGAAMVEPESETDGEINGDSILRENRGVSMIFEQLPLFKQLTNRFKRNLNVCSQTLENLFVV